MNHHQAFMMKFSVTVTLNVSSNILWIFVSLGFCSVYFIFTSFNLNWNIYFLLSFLQASGDRSNLNPSDLRSKQLLSTQTSHISYSPSPTSPCNIFPLSRNTLTASTTENKLSSEVVASLPGTQGSHFLGQGIPFYPPHHPQSMSPPPIPTVTTPPTPSSALYHSLPRGGRFAGRNNQRNLETTPYPSNSSAFSTIVRTKTPNLGSISTRGSDTSNRESSV